MNSATSSPLRASAPPREKSVWPVKRIGEVLQKTETVNPLQSPNKEFDYIDVSSVSNATFSIEETQRLKGKDAPSRARKLVKEKDIIFATIRPTLRRIAIVPKHLDNQICSTGYFVLRATPEISHRYLFYCLFTEDFMGRMESLQKGASYPAVTDGDVKSQEIPVPPLTEQERIVCILDEAFDGIAKAKGLAEANLQNARALFQSHLQSVFSQKGEGWVEKKLGEVCNIARGGSPRPIQKYLTTDPAGINWVKIGDATASGKYIFNTQQRIIPEGVKRSRLVKDGDFILSNSMSFGRPYIMKTSGCIHDGWLVLTDYSASLDQDYLYYILGSDLIYQQFDRLAAGSTVRNLNIDLASKVVIPIPSLKVQKSIVDKVENIAEETQRLESLYQSKLNALDELKKSLLYQAFSGNL